MVSQPLMIALSVIVFHKLADRVTQPCPQKFNPALCSLLFQAIFVVQAPQNRRRFDAVTGGKNVPTDAGRNLGLGWFRNAWS